MKTLVSRTAGLVLALSLAFVAGDASAFMIEGRFVDTAALRAARLTVELADAYGTSRP